MPFKTLDFKCALVTGGAGGIGRAITEEFLAQEKNVVIVGRTESKLKTAVEEMSNNEHTRRGNVSYYVLDTGDIPAIPAFISKITSEHPDLDCLVNNAGVQRPLDVNSMKPEEFLEKADQEVAINVTGPMHLAIRLLPHFKKQKGATIMNVSSVLGYVPTSIINPVYNGTKSMVHFWTMNLRTQLAQYAKAEGGSSIKIVEIVPPTVETELHRERENPDDNKKDTNKAALSIKEFMGEIKHGWAKDWDVVPAGMGRGLVDSWYESFGADYEKAASASVLK